MKKSLKKIFPYWKIIGLCIIVYLQPSESSRLLAGGTDANLSRQRSNSGGLTVTLHGADTAVTTPTFRTGKVSGSELTELRQELLDVHCQKEILERKYHGLRLRIAGLFGNDIAAQDSVQINEMLTESYGRLSESAYDLSLKASRIAFLLEGSLRDGNPLSDSDIVLFCEELADLRKTAETVSDLISPQGRDPSKGFQILDVNAELEMVAIAAGYKQGLRTGMVMWLKEEASEEEATNAIKLRIVEVRPDVASAIILQGDRRKVVPGMAVTAGKKNKQQ